MTCILFKSAGCASPTTFWFRNLVSLSDYSPLNQSPSWVVSLFRSRSDFWSSKIWCWRPSGTSCKRGNVAKVIWSPCLTTTLLTWRNSWTVWNVRKHSCRQKWKNGERLWSATRKGERNLGYRKDMLYYTVTTCDPASQRQLPARDSENLWLRLKIRESSCEAPEKRMASRPDPSNKLCSPSPTFLPCLLWYM